MRRYLAAAAAAVIGIGITSCGSSSGGGGGTPTGSASPSTAAACTHAWIESHLYAKGVLTVATDKPVYPPWFINNDPANGKGYESAVAYAIAAQLGFQPSQVKWAYEPFNASYAPGPKKFDFDINEVSYSSDRAKAVTFSNSYYADEQALVALKGTPIVAHHSPADMKKYVFGDQIGTTSLAYITSSIQPGPQPRIYQSLNDVKQALQTHQIAGFVTDTPTAQYVASSQIKHSLVVGRFPSTGEHFGLVFAKGNPLVTCVNKALATLTSNGTLMTLAKKYLQIYLTIPVIKP